MALGHDKVVAFREKIYPNRARGMVEKWLLQVAAVMAESIRHVIKDACEDYAGKERNKWIVEWPGQIVIAGSQVFWTMDCEGHIAADTLHVYLEQCNVSIVETVALVRGKLTMNARITLGALIVNDVHGE